MNPDSKPVQPAQPVPVANVQHSIDSEQLLKGANTVEIAHAGQRYLLRVTRENKLILTK